MTTIAYKQGVLAADKQGTCNGSPSGASYKVICTDDAVFAITGTLNKGLAFINWLTDGDENSKPPKLKGTLVLQMDKKTGKACLWEAGNVALPVEDKYYATGSGGDIALGAMYMGATPEEAVKAAIKHDISTGLGVQVHYSEAARRRLNKRKK